MMLLGAQTVTVRNYSLAGRDRLNAPIRTAVDTVVTGCSMQPVSVTEAVTLTDIETELWKCFLPPVAAALAADTTSEIVYRDATYQVLGARPATDFMGVTGHVALDLQKQLA
jgi:hypothetical protein